MLIAGAVAKGANSGDFATPTPHPSPQGGGELQPFRLNNQGFSNPPTCLTARPGIKTSHLTSQETGHEILARAGSQSQIF